jgi:hypothetical protein
MRVISPFAYIQEEVPRTAPPGKLFYVITIKPGANNRRYLQQVRRQQKPIFVLSRQGSMAFNDIDLANSYCRFLRAASTSEDHEHYFVVLEPQV